jgi:hypothetical protein
MQLISLLQENTGRAVGVAVGLVVRIGVAVGKTTGVRVQDGQANVG